LTILTDTTVFLASHGKVTPNVRKILQSQKTFANHLSDAEALAALAASQPQSAAATAAVGTPATPLSRASPASLPATNAKSTHKKGTKRKSEAAAAPAAKATPLRHVASTDTPTSFKRETGTMDVEMTDAPASASATDDIPRPLPPTQQLPPHKDDHNPLLISYIPVVPSQAELEALLNAPPLTYHEARGELKEEDLRKPPRRFCEICGYWGRVKCMKCGARVCALECLRTHGEDCYARYGA
jgi:zinc finger HIT domain-containing protein 1